MMKVGDRVVAVLCQKGGTVQLLGEGVYEGMHVPGKEVSGSIGETLRSNGIPDPKIRLDSGKIVWGCECWWGHPRQFDDFRGSCAVVEVDIDEVRTNSTANKTAEIG